MPAFQSSITTYLAKLAARESMATSDSLAFTVARHELEGELNDLGNYVNTVASAIWSASMPAAFPRTTPRAPNYSAPAAPTDVRLRQGDLSGSIVARYTPSRGQKHERGVNLPRRPQRRGELEARRHVQGRQSHHQRPLPPHHRRVPHPHRRGDGRVERPGEDLVA